MKTAFKQLFFFAFTAVMSLIFFDLIFSDEQKDIYWNSFNTMFNNIVIEDTGGQGQVMTEKYQEVFDSADGNTYKAGG